MWGHPSFFAAWREIDWKEEMGKTLCSDNNSVCRSVCVWGRGRNWVMRWWVFSLNAVYILNVCVPRHVCVLCFPLWCLTPQPHCHLSTLQQLSLWGPGAPLAPWRQRGWGGRRPVTAVGPWAELTGLEKPGLRGEESPSLCLLGISNDTRPQQMP